MTDEAAGRNLPPLSLHVPEPKYRPGDEVTFEDDASLSPAGAVARPAIDAAPAAMRDLPFALVRVLDAEARAVGPWDPKLSPDRVRRILGKMILVRAYDDRMYRAQRQGKTSFYMKCTGEEAVAVAAAEALDRGDMCFPSYRQQGLLIARDWSLVDMMCQVYSNRADRLKGRQLPIMYSVKEAGFFSISGNLTTQYPQAVGWAMASAVKGDTRIAAAWCGEGATAEGDFHAAMTFAAVFRVPVILNIVNNQWAISSFQGFAGGEETTFAARALGYGVAGLRIDGNDALAVYAATEWAAERARGNHGPTLIEHFTYRAEGHSTSDDPSAYRAAEEARRFPLGDPIERLKQHLIGLGEWDEARHEAEQARAQDEVRTAQKEAERQGVLSGSDFKQDFRTMFDDVFEEVPWHLAEQREQSIAERKVAGV